MYIKGKIVNEKVENRIMADSQTVICEWCGDSFEKEESRIKQTIKLRQKHTCSRSCASMLTNENRRCDPSTPNAEHTRRDKEKFPEKEHARYLVRQAVKTGRLIPQEECELCMSEINVQGHHPDHSRPFLLLYLCTECHKKADEDHDKYENLATDYGV